MAFPFRLERGHVDDDAAPRIGRFAQADHQHVARNAEIFDRSRQHETVGRNDADGALAIHEALGRKGFRVDDGRIDVREDLEFVRDARVVAVRGKAEGDDALALLGFDEGLDHGLGLRHLADPTVRHDPHQLGPRPRRTWICDLRLPKFSRSAAPRRASRSFPLGPLGERRFPFFPLWVGPSVMFGFLPLKAKSQRMRPRLRPVKAGGASP